MDQKLESAASTHAVSVSAETESGNTSKTSTVREWLEMIKFEHTVFALPFAMSGMILGYTSHTGEIAPGPITIFYTVLAFVGARSAAMTLNRLLDANIDALNPRTSIRAIPKGLISKKSALIFSILSFALMLGAASQLPPLCLQLSPIAVFWLSFYSFTKRFTWLCHIVLGIALGGASLGGWIAAGGSLATPAPWILSLAVSTWVAGFDLIYACQDVDFDREQKLNSIPARFGIAKALLISRLLHVVTASSLIALGLLMQLHAPYFVGVAIVCAMLVYEHSLVKPDDLSKVNAAFFTVNGVISILCFCCILAAKIF